MLINQPFFFFFGHPPFGRFFLSALFTATCQSPSTSKVNGLGPFFRFISFFAINNTPAYYYNDNFSLLNIFLLHSKFNPVT